MIRLWLGLAACTLLTSAVAFPLLAGTMQCDDAMFRVNADDQAIRQRTCQIASRTKDTLASCGVTLKRPIEIRVREQVTGEIGDCLGIYHCGKDVIEILSPSAMSRAREKGTAFGPVSDGAFWESVIAHELTHAVYDTVSCPFTSCVATAEYASYAMQVWSLPDHEKALFGKDTELRTKPTRDAVSAMMLFMAPNRFALIAWLHFKGRPDPCGYMQNIMDGDIFFDREPL